MILIYRFDNVSKIKTLAGVLDDSLDKNHETVDRVSVHLNMVNNQLKDSGMSFIRYMYDKQNTPMLTLDTLNQIKA